MTTKISRIFKITIPVFLMMVLTAQAQVLSNEQVVIAAVRNHAEHEFTEFGFSAVQMKMAEGGINRLISNGLAEAFRAKDIQVVTRENQDFSGRQLLYDLLGFDFSYENGRSRGFMKRRMLKRIFSARLRITLKNLDDGSILTFKDLAISYSDQIDPEFIDLVKSRHIPDLAPEVPPRGWAKFAEPIIVTTAVGALVYLFFANR